ncbi:hypothetical protein ACFE04_019759 [Oxalis oulophora]
MCSRVLLHRCVIPTLAKMKAIPAFKRRKIISILGEARIPASTRLWLVKSEDKSEREGHSPKSGRGVICALWQRISAGVLPKIDINYVGEREETMYNKNPDLLQAKRERAAPVGTMTRTANLEGYAAEWVLVINVRTILISFFGHFRKFGSPPGNRFSGGGSVSAHVFRISVQDSYESCLWVHRNGEYYEQNTNNLSSDENIEKESYFVMKHVFHFHEPRS